MLISLALPLAILGGLIVGVALAIVATMVRKCELADATRRAAFKRGHAAQSILRADQRIAFHAERAERFAAKGCSIIAAHDACSRDYWQKQRAQAVAMHAEACAFLANPTLA